MASVNYHNELCLKVIQEHFGSIVQSVAKELIRGEVVTLAHLVRTLHDELTPEQIRFALVILFQHDCINIEQPPIEGADPTLGKGFNYRIHKQAVINRLRFASLLLNIRDLFGDIGVFIIERFIDHGKISFGHLAIEYEQFVQSSESLEGLAASSRTEQEIAEAKSILRDTFNALVAARYIKAAPLFTPQKSSLLEQQHAQDVSKKALSSTSSASAANSKKTVASTDSVARKRRISTPAAAKTNPMNEFDTTGRATEDDSLPLELRMLFKMEEESKMNTNEEAEMTFQEAEPATKRMRKVDSVAALHATNAKKAAVKKGGRVIADEEEDLPVVVTQSSVEIAKTPTPELTLMTGDGLMTNDLWMINWEQYDRTKRHELCVTYCKERMGSLAGSLCKHLLDYSIKYEAGRLSERSIPMLLTELYAAFTGTTAGANGKKESDGINLDAVKKILHIMTIENTIICNNIPSSTPNSNSVSYSVNITIITGKLKQRTIHDIICERYGVQSGRIIEVLRQYKYVEQQKISDSAIVPAREAREKLYALYKDKWVNYYEVSKSSSSGSNAYNPSSTVYLWYYNNADGYNSSCNNTLISSIYMIMYKLKARYSHELDAGRILVEVGQSANYHGAVAASSNNSAEEPNVDTVELLQLRLSRLQRSVGGLLDSLFLIDL